MRNSLIRKLYNSRFLPDERRHFLIFLRSLKPHLALIRKSGGKIEYILKILELIHDEEMCHPFRKQGRYIPYPWEFKNAKVIFLSEREITIKKIEGGKEVELKNPDTIPEEIIKK